MRKCVIIPFIITAAAGSAAALPSGLSGWSVGIGAGGLTTGYIQGEYDFTLSRYVCLGPEVAIGFGGPGALYGGCAGRYYVIPDLHPVFQPHLAFGAGAALAFDKEETPGDEGGGGIYLHFAFGCDFDIPRAPISPYLDFGGFFVAGSASDATFKVEIGVRFAI